MSIRAGLIILLSITPSADAMKTAIQSAFEETLKTGTEQAIKAFVGEYQIKFDTRCIQWNLNIRYSDQRPAYPFEYAIQHLHSRSEERLKSILTILIQLGAPVDTYADYSPLIHVISLCISDDKIPLLLQLGANPNRSVLYQNLSVTPLQYVTGKMTESVTVPGAAARLSKIKNLFLNSTELKGQKDVVSCAPVTSNAMLAGAVGSGVSMLTYQQGVRLAVVSFVAGVICVRCYDWCGRNTDEGENGAMEDLKNEP